MPILAGDIIGGKYRVEHVLGEGGMGIVVAARHVELEELYAIKIMKRESLGCETQAERRFLGEARAAARLKGAHVAHVHDIGRLGTGELYMVMEYLQGTDLKKLVRTQGPLPVPVAIGYVLQACEAIAEAHGLGIIHRDIKPNNLFLLEGTNSIKVLDFGVSKQPAAHNAELTGTNVILGTLSYMAPEQIQKSKNVDVRSDIWSLGVVLYELVTGGVPFLGDGIIEVFAQVSKDRPTPPSELQPGVPAAFDAIVARCMRVDPARRYRSVHQLALALHAVQATSGVTAECLAPHGAPPAEPPASPGICTSDATTPRRGTEVLADTQLTTRQAGSATRRDTWKRPIAYAAAAALVIAIVARWLPFDSPAPAQAVTRAIGVDRREPPAGDSPSAGSARPIDQHSAEAPGPAARPESRQSDDEHLDLKPAPPPSTQPGGEHPVEKPVASPLPAPNKASSVKRSTRRPPPPPAPSEPAPPPAPSDPRAPGIVADPAPRAQKSSYCAATQGEDFSVSLDLSHYTKTQRLKFVASGECQGNPAQTKLCCHNEHIGEVTTPGP